LVRKVGKSRGVKEERFGKRTVRRVRKVRE